MKINSNGYNGCAVALGTFDGLHRGHMRLINGLFEQPESLLRLVYTFSTLPGVYFGTGEKSLFTPEEKRAAFKRLGLDILLMPPFDMRMACTGAEQFVDMLTEKLRAKVIIVGFNYTFGAGGRGNPDVLKELCEPLGVKVIVCEPVMDGQKPVSSTLIRGAVSRGEVAQAAHMLGRSYSIGGRIVVGKQIGRTINFPTINILPAEGKLYPAEGVYATRARVGGGEALPAMTNIGTRPTIDGDPTIKIETHIFGYDKNVYGQNVEIEFVEFLRPVEKFAGTEALSKQLKYDKSRALELLGAR